MFLENIWSDSNPDLFKESIAGYLAFLELNRERIPNSVYEFANADWHYNTMDHRCPHDAWLESLEIKEISTEGEKRSRSNSIYLILLGAYHNGKLHLSYDGVTNYSFERNTSSDDPFLESIFRNGHGDLLVDEFSMSEENEMIHNLSFSNGVTWKIQFRGFSFEWIPLSEK